MKKRFYHATPMKNLISILDKGIKVGCDGITYLAESREEAYRFVALKCFEEVLVIEVELEETKVRETFDHNYNFFMCRAFGYPETIKTREMTNFWKFERN